MTKSIEKVATSLVKWLMPFCLLTCVPLLSSCEEDDDDDGDDETEFDNWKERNDLAIADWAADTSLKKVRNYTLNENAPAGNGDYVYVKVLEAGNGIGCPMLTDSVRIAYRGRLIPSKTYPEGYVFDQSYLNDFSWKTAYPAQFPAPNVVLITGLQSALLQMHIGDRWEVYVPYTLGYGTSNATTSSGVISVPAYSTLIFDIRLVAFWRADGEVPEMK